MQPEILILSSPISFCRSGAANFLGNLLRDRDRAGIGQGAEIEARAADHVGNGARIALGQTRPHQRVIDGAQVRQRHMRQHQVLLVRHPQLVEGIALGEVATASICTSVASPGAPPTGLSEIVTEA